MSLFDNKYSSKGGGFKKGKTNNKVGDVDMESDQGPLFSESVDVEGDIELGDTNNEIGNVKARSGKTIIYVALFAALVSIAGYYFTRSSDEPTPPEPTFLETIVEEDPEGIDVLPGDSTIVGDTIK